VPLLVCGDQERPLVGVASLPWHDAAPKVVARGPDVLPQLRMLLANGVDYIALSFVSTCTLSDGKDCVFLIPLETGYKKQFRRVN